MRVLGLLLLLAILRGADAGAAFSPPECPQAVLRYRSVDGYLYRSLTHGELHLRDCLPWPPATAARARGLAGLLVRSAEEPRLRGSLDRELRTLAALLVGDWARRLPTAVTVDATGELADFPFAALPLPAGTAERRYLGTAHVLLRFVPGGTPVRARHPRHDRPLLLAPALGGRLDFHRREVAELARRSGGRHLTGPAATPAALFHLAPDHAVIHLATHAAGGRTLDLDDGAGGTVSLKARDIAAHRLAATLVCLSACETGLGARDANSLVAAFRRAGVRYVVASLWPIDDRATVDWMRHFYAALAEGNPVPAAVRAGRRRFLAEHAGTRYDHPYFWAGLAGFGGGEN